MKRERLTPIFLFSLTLFLISFVIGYQLMHKRIDNRLIGGTSRTEMKAKEKKELDKALELEIISEENTVTPNTLLEEKTYYSECQHTKIKSHKIDEEFINMTEQEFIKYLDENYPNKKVIDYSSNKITLGVSKNHLCEDHYIIGEEDGFIAILKIGENGERLVDKVFTDYPISLLMDIDQEKIKTGIIVDSLEELSEILENFIS